MRLRRVRTFASVMVQPGETMYALAIDGVSLQLVSLVIGWSFLDISKIVPKKYPKTGHF